MRKIWKWWKWIIFINDWLMSLRFSSCKVDPLLLDSCCGVQKFSCGWTAKSCLYVVRLTHRHHQADPRHCSYQELRPPFVRNVALEEVISLCHSSSAYPIPSSFLEVSDMPTNDTRMIIIIIMYWFSSSIVALWVSAFPCIIVGLQTG